MIIVRTPLRLSFVGGGSDINFFYEQKDGMVISCAMDKFVYVIVKGRFDDKIYINYSRKECVDHVDEIGHDLVREAMKITGVEKGVEITTLADIPSEGSGLGSSSSITVGRLHAFYAYQNMLVTAEQLCPKCGQSMDWQWTPETHVAPPNAYAMAKYSQELQAITFGRRYQIPSVVLRYSIVQGPRQSFYNAYSGACRIFCLSYYFDKAPPLYEDGLQCRDFVNIRDVVQANLMALEDDRMDYGVFNVGGGHAYTVEEFAEIVRREVQKHKRDPLPEPDVPGWYRFGDTRNACSDISKLKALGWEPKHTPVESVREYVSWLYEQDNVEDIMEYAMKTMQSLNVVRR